MSTKTHFEALKKAHKTHKAAAKYLGVSYSRYNEWRWKPELMPAYAKRLVEFAAEFQRLAALR